MVKIKELSSFELIYIIVAHGMGTKVLQKAKEYGVSGGTIFNGKGTISNSLLNFLSIYDQSKEVILIGTDFETSEVALKNLNKEFEFDKPNHGFAFSISAIDIVGSSILKTKNQNREDKIFMYQNIITIVNRGKAEEVIEAARKAGSKGGTIINARGSGIHETSKLFNMEIEPEKEIVIILSKIETTDSIVESIKNKLEIEKPGRGIIFIQNVSKVYGFYEK